MDLEEKYIPSVLGKGGETVRSIEKETGCKIDVNRQHMTLTVRGGTDAERENAINKFTAIIDEEDAKAAERAAAKAAARQELAENAKEKASSTGGTKSTTPTEKQPPKEIVDVSGAKDRSGEFATTPVGMTALATNKADGNKTNGKKEKGPNPCIHGTEEGHQLYQWLLTGKVGDLIAGDVYSDSDSESSSDSDESGDSARKDIIMKKDEDGKDVPYYKTESGVCVRL